jgi:hypothetical protein
MNANMHMVGAWTAPWVLHDRAAQLDAHVVAFDRDVRALDATEFARLRTDWLLWASKWKSYYAGLTGLRGAIDYLPTLPVQISADDVAAQIDSYRKDLEAFQLRYKNETGHPPQTIPSPSAPEAPKTSSFDFSVPWWGWVLGGAAVVGFGYLAFTSIRTTNELRSQIGKAALKPYGF